MIAWPLLKAIDNNVNYLSVYQLILQLVKEDYLTIDPEKIDMDKQPILKMKIYMIYGLLPVS